MNDDQPIEGPRADLLARIAELKLEHQALADAVVTLSDTPRPDQIQIARLKKKKLLLKDMITRLEDQLTPDIIA